MAMRTAAWAVLAGIGGMIVGSFLNVVAYRLPRGESLISPGSRCPECGTPIKAYDNVPVLGWLLLRGRCRACGAAISPRYPLVEAGTGVLCAVVVLRFGADADVWLPLAFVLLLVPVTLIDLDHRIIPNPLMLVGAVLGVGLVLLTRSDDVAEHAIAAVAAFGFFLLAALAYPSGMGMGDVKLAGVMGLFLGRDVAPALLIALLVGSLAGLAIIARKGQAAGRKTAVPFGPFLALGGVLALFVGEPIVDWYLDTFFDG
jgi:leader peptidase (prepilin peptidase) / N-methyltransferase